MTRVCWLSKALPSDLRSFVCCSIASLCLQMLEVTVLMAVVVLVWVDSRAFRREVTSFRAAVMAVLCAMDCWTLGGRLDARKGVTCSPECVRLWEGRWVGGVYLSSCGFPPVRSISVLTYDCV